MKSGDKVIAIKGDKKGIKGTILAMEGTGQSRKWRIRWADNEVSSLHAKSFKILADEQISESTSESEEESEANEDISNSSDSTSVSESSSISFSDDSYEARLAEM